MTIWLQTISNAFPTPITVYFLVHVAEFSILFNKSYYRKNQKGTWKVLSGTFLPPGSGLATRGVKFIQTVQQKMTKLGMACLKQKSNTAGQNNFLRQVHATLALIADLRFIAP